MTASAWRLFDVRPVIGRFFTDDENVVPTGTQVAVLSYAYWQSAVGGRADAVGGTTHHRPARLHDHRRRPEGFAGTSMAIAVAILPDPAALVRGLGPARAIPRTG